MAPDPTSRSRPRRSARRTRNSQERRRGADAAGGEGGRLYSIPGMPPDLTSPPKACRFAPRCRYVQDRCREAEPDLEEGSFGHAFRCYFPVGSPDDEEPVARLQVAERKQAEHAARAD